VAGEAAVFSAAFGSGACSGLSVFLSEEKKKKNSRPSRNNVPAMANTKGSLLRGERPRSWIYSGSFSGGRSCSVRAKLLFEKPFYFLWAIYLLKTTSIIHVLTIHYKKYLWKMSIFLEYFIGRDE